MIDREVDDRQKEDRQADRMTDFCGGPEWASFFCFPFLLLRRPGAEVWASPCFMPGEGSAQWQMPRELALLGEFTHIHRDPVPNPSYDMNLNFWMLGRWTK